MPKPTRRTFLQAAAAVPVAAATPPPFPTIALGRYRVTRLIAGANPVNGYSHCTQRLSDLMSGYFTVERTTQFLLDCERQGITTWQSSYAPKVRDALTAARERGSKIQFICLTSGREDAALKDILALRPMAIVHHGGVTDSLFHADQSGVVRDYVRKIHDLGVLAGISTHNPENLARIEDSGWENDFYMTCVYNLSRTPEEIRKMTGDRVLGELFLASDPQLMTRRIREVRKPCLAFKILAAGRLSQSAPSVDRAFQFAYQNIKPSDAVIVGMYPVLSDEVAEDAALARRYAG